MHVDLEINVTPSPLPRARHASRGGFVSSYYTAITKDKFNDYTNAILKALEEQSEYSQEQLLQASKKGNTLSVSCAFYLPIPKSTSKKRTVLMEDMWHDKKPDLDNLIKMILDRCTGILFEDDNNVSKIIGVKKYSQNPRIKLFVEYKPLNSGFFLYHKNN